jgi:hypothetical protein
MNQSVRVPERLLFIVFHRIEQNDKSINLTGSVEAKPLMSRGPSLRNGQNVRGRSLRLYGRYRPMIHTVNTIQHYCEKTYV